MTREELQQISKLDKEIESIERAIRLRLADPSDVILFYKDYRTGKGIPKAEAVRDDGQENIRLLKRLLAKKKRILLKRLVDAEKFIGSVQDSTMRTILREIYVNGSSQQETADIVGYSQPRVNQKLTEFWASQNAKDR